MFLTRKNKLLRCREPRFVWETGKISREIWKILLVLKEEEKRDRLGDIEYIDLSFSGRPVVCYRK